MLLLFSIGWTYISDECFTIEEFEKERKTINRKFPLNKQERHDLLLEWGVKRNELLSSVRKNLKAKHQRRRTFINSTSRYDRWEEAVESASRKIKKSWASVFSTDSTTILSKRDATVTPKRDAVRKPERLSLRTCSTSESMEFYHHKNASHASTIKAASRIILSTKFEKAAVPEPSASNAQKPIRPPPSPYKSIPKQQQNDDSFPKIVLDDDVFDIKSTATRYYEEDEDSIMDDSSSRSTEYTDSEEEDYVSISDSSSHSAIDTQ